MIFQSPLRIFEVGRAKDDEIARFVLSTYGGGMVQGDQIDLKIRAGEGSKSLIQSQANTHILKNNTQADTVFSINATVEIGAELVFTMEPTVLHRQGRFHQKQHWKLQKGARLILLDWFQSGRCESGETYEFSRYQNELQITVENQDILVENFVFEPHHHDHRNAASLGGMDHVATLYLVGDFGPQIEEVLKIPGTKGEKKRFRPLEPRQESQAPRDKELVASSYQVGPCQVFRLLATKRTVLEPILKQVLELLRDKSP